MLGVCVEASPHARIKELAVANLLRGLLDQPLELLSSFGSDVGLHKSTHSGSLKYRQRAAPKDCTAGVQKKPLVGA